MEFLVDIAPLARLKAEQSVLSYLSDTELPTGTLVQIPLGRSLTEGIVWGVPKEKPTFKLKSINSVSEITLLPYQLELARWIADYYASSLGQSLQLFVPRGLEKKRREKPASTDQPPLPAPPKLSSNQQQALTVINESQITLLHGVTSSGKTEVYLRVLNEVLRSGKSAIILVPEISLTPQTFERFEARFPGRVALWHSKLTEAERARTWQNLRNGEKSVVIGSRSAIFAPLKNLGLIVIDEEHDPSYKQDSGVHYHARTVAAKLADLTNSKLVLGSATPSLETYSEASSGQIGLATLPKRVAGTKPEIEIVDLRLELKRGNRETISGKLLEALRQALSRNEQAVLFLNRRGIASSVICRDCGEAIRCPRCQTTLTYHKNEKLLCHYCGFRMLSPRACPACGSLRIRYIGAGTQTVERDLLRHFPDAKILRMDRDTTTSSHSHRDIFERFRSGEADILLGTQMVTKGWDIPNVSLVGILLADLSLTLPDFRGSETTFQLLSQVAGRSGRGTSPGQVIIQTYLPEHPVLAHVRRSELNEFYTEELELRKSLGYPPYGRLISLQFAHRDEQVARTEAEKLAAALTQITKESIQIIGPAPSFIPKLRGKYYYQIVIKSPLGSSTDSLIAQVPDNWSVNVDPENLLS